MKESSIKIDKDKVYFKKYGISGFVFFKLPSGFSTDEDYHKNFLKLTKNIGFIMDFTVNGISNKKNRYLTDFMTDFILELSDKSELFRRFSKYSSIAFNLRNIHIKNIEKCFDVKLINQLTSLNLENCIVHRDNCVGHFTSLRYLLIRNTCISNMDAFKRCTAKIVYMKDCYLKYNMVALGTMFNLEELEIIGTKLNNSIDFLFCFSNPKIKKLKFSSVGSFSLIPLLAIKNSLQELSISGDEVTDLDVIDDLQLEYFKPPQKMYSRELSEKCRGLSKRTKLVKSILVTDKNEFFKLINNSKAVHDLSVNLITDGYVDLSIDEYYKTIVKNASFYPKNEIVDHNGISFLPPF